MNERKRPAPPFLDDVPGLLAGKTEAEALELRRIAADGFLRAQRIRRRIEAESTVEDRWSFAVPRPAALLFDAMAREGLMSGVLALDVLPVAAGLGMDQEALASALAALASHELATVSGEGLGARVTLHPELRYWF